MNKMTALVWLLLFPSTCLGWLRADLNEDGIVDLNDFAIFASQWLWSEDMTTKYAQFDGTGRITVPDKGVLDVGTGDFTICFWTKYLQQTNARILSKNKFESGNVTGIQVLTDYNDSIKLRLSNIHDGDSFSQDGYLTISALDLPHWNFIVFSYDASGNGVGYLNGTPVATLDVSTFGSLDAEADLTLGESFAGFLDDLRLYKSALTAEQVLILFGLGRTYVGSGETDGLPVPDWRMNFDMISGNTIKGGSELNGTATNGVTFVNDGYIPQTITGISLADEITEALNAGEYAMSFTAARRLMPFYELKDLAQLKATVMPKSIEVQPHDRNSSLYNCEIDIAIQKAVAFPDDPEVSQLADLVMSITNAFRNKYAPCGAVCYKQTVDPIYSADHMQSPPVFTSVITLSFKWVS
jgi:hypothetical protein